MYIYIYTDVCTCVHSMCACIYTYVFICVHIYTHTYIHIYTHLQHEKDPPPLSQMTLVLNQCHLRGGSGLKAGGRFRASTLDRVVGTCIAILLHCILHHYMYLVLCSIYWILYITYYMVKHARHLTADSAPRAAEGSSISLPQPVAASNVNYQHHHFVGHQQVLSRAL